MKPSSTIFFLFLALLVCAPHAYAQDAALVVTEDGNVGVGTNAPTDRLQLGDFDAGEHYLSIKSEGGNQWRNGIRFRNFNENFGWTIANDERFDRDGLHFLSHFDDPDGVPRLFLAKFGGVGIGTLAPQDALQIGDFDTEAHQYLSIKTEGGQLYDAGIRLLHFNDEAGFTLYSDDAGRRGSIGLHIFRHHGNLPAGGVNAFTIDRLNGNVGLAVPAPTHPLHLASGAHATAGGVWTNASSRDFKQDIEALTLEAAVEALHALEPVRYAYKRAPDDPQVGFIAEDVPELVATPDRQGLSPMDVVAVLTRIVQEQQRRIEALEARLAAEEEKE